MANPFIDAILAGRQPSVQDFLTPGINPAAPDYRKQIPSLAQPRPSVSSTPSGAFGKLDQFLGTPGGGFLLNLLAQSGYSPMPDSPFGAIGRAGLMTAQQQRQRSQDDLQKQLIEAQIGYYDRKDSPLSGLPASVLSGFEPSSVVQAMRTGNLDALKPVGPEAADVNKLVNELADDIRAESKDFSKQHSSFGLIRAAAEDPSPAGDLALIFNYMKVLDPGSTVREGEFANAQNSGSVPQRVWSMYNNVMEGTRLSAPQRADFVNRAARLYNSAAKEQRERNQRFKRRGLNAKLPEPMIEPLLLPANDFPLPKFDPSPAANAAALQEEIAKLEAEIAELEQR